MNMNDIVKRLDSKGIRPTAVRLLVAQVLAEATSPLSLADIETVLDTAPKSTIFRALNIFLEHRLVHCFEDGSGSLKYELCDNDEECNVGDMHTHFYCEKCQRTFCLRNTQVPIIELPDGFTMNSVNYMVKGVCDECRK